MCPLAREAYFTCEPFGRVTNLSWLAWAFSILVLKVPHSETPSVLGKPGQLATLPLGMLPLLAL